MAADEPSSGSDAGPARSGSEAAAASDKPAASTPAAEAEGEPKAECALCRVFKDSPCGTEFSKWDACMTELDADGAVGDAEAEKARCGDVVTALRECHDKHAEYFADAFDRLREEHEAAEMTSHLD